jgi:hypothetical protein
MVLEHLDGLELFFFVCLLVIVFFVGLLLFVGVVALENLFTQAQAWLNAQVNI